MIEDSRMLFDEFTMHCANQKNMRRALSTTLRPKQSQSVCFGHFWSIMSSMSLTSMSRQEAAV